MVSWHNQFLLTTSLMEFLHFLGTLMKIHKLVFLIGQIIILKTLFHFIFWIMFFADNTQIKNLPLHNLVPKWKSIFEQSVKEDCKKCHCSSNRYVEDWFFKNLDFCQILRDCLLWHLIFINIHIKSQLLGITRRLSSSETRKDRFKVQWARIKIF